MGMILSFGFSDTVVRFGDTERKKREPRFVTQGSFVFGGDYEVYSDAECICVSDSVVFDDSDLRKCVNDGVCSFKKVDAMLSFVHFNKNTLDILVVGDYLGRLPLYYYYQKNLFGHRLLIASEIKCFRGLPRGEVKQIEMGGYVTFKGGVFSVGSYSKVSRVGLARTDLECVAGVRELLFRSVDKMVKHTSGLCVFLSGGLASAVVAAIAKSFRKDLVAFTFSVGDGGMEDLHFARLAAKHLEIQLVEVIVSREDVLKVLDEVLYFSEDSDWRVVCAAVVKYFLAKAASDRGFSAALCGDVASSVFVSYPDVDYVRWSDEQFLETRDKFISRANVLPGMGAKVLGNAGGMICLDPYGDREFLEFASNVPAEFKEGVLECERVNRILLRSAFQNLLPKEITMRAKGNPGTAAFVDGALAEHRDSISARHMEILNKNGHVPVDSSGRF